MHARLMIFAAAAAVGMAGCDGPPTVREQFLELLKEYARSVPQPDREQPEGLQALRMDRIREMRRK